MPYQTTRTLVTDKTQKNLGNLEQTNLEKDKRQDMTAQTRDSKTLQALFSSLLASMIFW